MIKKSILSILLLFILFILSACGENTQFKNEAGKVIKLMDQRMENGEELTGKDEQIIDVFIEKYSQSDTPEFQFNFANEIFNLKDEIYSYQIATNTNDIDLKQKSISGYIGLSKKLKKELGIED